MKDVSYTYPVEGDSHRVFAVFATVLVVLSMLVGPVAAGMSGGPKSHDASGPMQTEPDFSVDGSGTETPERRPTTSFQTPLPVFLNASDQLSTIVATNPAQENHLERAQRRLQRSIDGFEDPVRITDHRVLTDASQSTRALRSFAQSGRGNKIQTTAARGINATSHKITVGANHTARLRLFEAQQRLAAVESALSKGQYRSLESHIQNAQRALDRAERNRDRSRRISLHFEGETTRPRQLRRVLRLRAQATTQYRVAWQQSTTVLERLDRLDPDVPSVDSDGDTLTDSRERALGTNVSLADSDYDGIDDSRETVGGLPIDSDGDGTIDSLDADSDDDGLVDYAEGTNDTDEDGVVDFRDTDDDGDGISTLGELRDSRSILNDVDFDGTNSWYDVDADGDGVRDGVEGRIDQDGDGLAAYLDNDRDNDGLPDFYERNVTKTEVGDNDSDSDVTAGNEGGNDVLDGLEDFDNDTLIAAQERVAETDPFDPDTDGDGLKDGFEVGRSSLDPLEADSDGDGVLDGSEDPDGDGLNNTAEVRQETQFDAADTDGDDLDDGREVSNGTGPLAEDTDEDGLPDADEYLYGLDPLDEDTDADGVLDGDEQLERTVRNDQTGVSVAIEGTGGANATIEPRPSYTEGVENITAGPSVRIENRTAFSEATVRIPIDDAVAQSEYDDLAIFKWNGSAKGRWHPIDTSISNGVATADVESFSYFTVLDTDEWTGYVSVGPADGEPIAFTNRSSFDCADACEVANETTLVLGGEPSARKIVVEQPGLEEQIVPISNGQDIGTFYDYADAEINSPLPIAKSDVSRLWVWSGPNGLSLVTVHDEPQDGSGAAVSFEFSGLPTTDGSWVVEDDPNDFHDGATTPDWTWTDDNTDGGAFRGGLTDQTITITPKFNEEADRAPLTSGELRGWEVVTGRATDPRSISLDMDEPVTLRIPDAPSTDPSDPAGDTGYANWTYTNSDTNTSFAITYQTEQTDIDPSATVTATGANGQTIKKGLSIGTVGTVQERMNLSSLANPIAFNTSVDGVNARIQVTSTRTLEDSDGDGLPDYREEQSWITSSGPLNYFSTDPYDNDTDDDGLNDSQEVSFVPYEDALSNDDATDCERGFNGAPCSTAPNTFRPVTIADPTRYDTDGDGLSDRREIVGTNTTVAFEPDSARAYQRAVRDNESNAERHLRNITVASSPLQTHSDSDGFSDGEEVALGLSPTNADTDQDTLDDDTEVYNQWYARLHDFRPPRITGQVRADGDRENFRFEFTVRDQSQIGSVRVFKGGQQRAEETAYGTDLHEDSLSWHIESDLAGELINPIAGYVEPPTARGQATDIHGNTGPKRKFRGPNNFGKIAGGFAKVDLPVLSPAGVAVFSTAFGFAQGVNVFKNDIITTAAVLGKPDQWDDAARKTVQGLNRLKQIATSSEKRQKAMAAMVKHYGQRRSQLNPFEEGSRYRDAFAVGYSGGYAATFLVPVAAEAKAAQVAARLPYISALLRSVGTMQRTIRGVTIGSAMWTGGRIAKRMPDVEFNVGRRVSDVDLDSRAKHIVGKTADTLGNTPLPRQRRIAELARNTGDSDVMDWLTRRVDAPDSDRYERGLVYLRRTGAEGKQLLSRLSPDVRSSVLRLRDKAGLQRQLTKAWVRGDIDAADIGTATRRYENLDAETRTEFDDLVQREGPDAIAVSGKVDDETFDAIIRADISTDRKAARLDSISEVGDMSRFERLREAVGQKAFRLAQNLPGDGDRLETLLRQTDLRTQRIIADGSGDLDTEFDRTFAKALADDDVNNDVLEQASERVDELGDIWGTDTAQFGKRLFIESPDSGSRFLATFDDAQIHQLSTEVSDGTVSRASVIEFVDGVENFKQLRFQTIEAEGVSMSQLAKFIDSSDGYAARLANDLGGGKLAGAIDLEPVNRNVLTEVAYDGSLDGKDALASDSLTARDMLELSDHTGLNNLQMIAKTGPNGNTRHLTTDRWNHIRGRHITGTEPNPNADVTSFYPSGQEVTKGGVAVEVPDSDIADDDIRVMIRETIEAGGEESDFPIDKHGIEEFRVGIGDNGVIKTAYPVRGEGVVHWNGQKFEVWDSETNSWVDYDGPTSTQPSLIDPIVRLQQPA